MSVDCPPVSLTGMDDIQGCSHRCPRLRGDTGLGGGAEMFSENRLLSQGLGMAGQWLGE